MDLIRVGNLINLSEYICKRYLRFKHKSRHRRYAHALSLYLIYDDLYLTMKDVDLNILFFLAKIIKNNFIISKKQISNLTRSEISNYFQAGE